MALILVYSEQERVAFELLTIARGQADTAAVVLGPTASARAEAWCDYGAKEIYVGEDESLAAFQADLYAEALAQVVAKAGASTVLLGSTKRGKELAGRLAEKLDAGAVVDAIGLQKQDGRWAVQRYALGGNTIATEVITSERQVIAVLPRTFEAVKQPATGQVTPIEVRLSVPRVKVIERRAKPPATVNIESADRIVVAGKGFAKQEDLALAQMLAQALHGEVGCTRALSADYHWLDEERMIGISGKRCKPRLLISAGVSGEIQHTVGILGAKVIVAINKDKAAPIFKVADYGIVGDLYEVLPKLGEQIGKRWG